MPKKAASPEIKAASFETSLSELEQIVTRLESGELPLEDALNEFETGCTTGPSRATNPVASRTTGTNSPE